MDCRFLSRTFVPQTINVSFADVPKISDQSARTMMLDDYIDRLEVEMQKIDAFKRELPHVMLLVNDVIVTMKEELVKCKRWNQEPVLEEFIPLKKSCNNDDDDDDDDGKDDKSEYCEERDVTNSKDKMDWMSSVQLWNSDYNENKRGETDRTTSMDRLNKNRTMDGAYMPFKKAKEDHKDELSCLSLRMPEFKNLTNSNDCSNNSSLKSSFSRSNSSSGHQQQKSSRKARRCWSPDLHRRFIDAMDQLGGPEVATPKQIREQMQVEGLTNDEVKSHLQKYRLHLRKARLNGGDESSKRKRNSQFRSPKCPLRVDVSSGMNGGDSYEEDEDFDGESESTQ